MDRRLIPDTEARLTLLAVLDALGPVTDEQLTRFVVEYDVMGYFDLRLNLAALVDQGQVLEEAHPLGGLFRLTPEGLFALRSFEKRIPQSRRELFGAQGPRWAERFRLEQEAPARTQVLPGQHLALSLGLVSQGEELMRLTFTLDRPTIGAGVQESWQRAAADVYAAISQALGADCPPPPDDAADAVDAADTADSPDAADAVDAEAPGGLVPLEGGGVLLTLRLSATPELALRLRLPDQRIARHYARRWPREAPALHALITRRLGLGGKSQNNTGQ